MEAIRVGEGERNVKNTTIKEVLFAIQLFICKLGLNQDAVEFKFDGEKIERCPEEIKVKQLLSLIEELVQQLKKIKRTKLQEEVSDLDLLPLKKQRVDVDDKQNKQDVKNVDCSLVQVTADNKEINRRISAFIERKQNEVDQLNRREFCNVVDSNQEIENSCARTESVFVPRLGQTSHIKVTRVDNTNTSDEAQTLDHVTGLQGAVNSRTTSQRAKVTCNAPAVNERVRNMEQFLSLNPGRPVAPDIYDKLQYLENRILCLEGLSPEYFHNRNSSGSSRSLPYPNAFESQASSSSHFRSYETMSIDAMDERIQILKQSLQRKQPENS